MKISRILTALILFSLLILPLSEARGISATIEGPTVVGTGETCHYKIYVNGYFDEYQIHVLLAGENLTGASPINETFNSSANNVFNVNITFPTVPGTVYIYVQSVGIVNGSQPSINITYLQVKVIKSIPFIVKVKNPTPYTIKNVNVTFYLDGSFAGNVTVPSISPNSTVNVTYNYVGIISNGTHTLKAIINSNVLEFSTGSRSYTIQFYYGKPPDYTWVWYVIAFIVIISIFFYYTFSQSKKRPALPKWKR